ncbi:MAG: homocysteine S-methyltransferase family protein [Alphaproteobacteria bacterium]
MTAPGRPVVVDGAMGTELFRRGMALDQAGWSALGVVRRPDLVRSIHEDYARAGAEVHITNTFATSRHILESIGHGDEVKAINVRAVELCREASAGRAVPGWIAGSVSTYARGSSRAALPLPSVLQATFGEQCRILAEAGVDALALEMLLDVDLSLIMAEAAAATGLPYWLGFTCRQAPDGTVVSAAGGYRGGHDRPFADVLRDVLAGLPKGGFPIVAVMHNELDVTDGALDVVLAQWSGPIVVYPNSGIYLNPGWDFATVCSPADFVAAAGRWYARGVAAVGGCCGLGPAHIAALAESLDGR